MSCPGNKQWYACSKGNFHGCCSSDPCNSGICPDDSQGTDQSGPRSNPVTSLASSPTTNSPSTTTATKPATSPKTGSGASASPPTTVMSSSSSSSLPSTETLTAAPETASTTGSSSGGSNASGDSGVHGGLIEGVVAGSVAAFLLVVGIILLVCYRSRKKHGKDFTLLGWYRPQYIRSRRYPREQQQQRSGCGNGRGACCGGAYEKAAAGGEWSGCFHREEEGGWGVCGWDRANTKRSRLRHNFFMQLLQYTIIDAASRNPHFYFHHNPQCQCCWGQHAQFSNKTTGKYTTVDYLLAVARGTIPTVSVDNSQDQTSA